MTLRWTRPALTDLAQILDYLAERNPGAAAGVARILETAVQRLNAHPDSGRIGRVAGTKELVIPRIPYVIAYRVTGQSVEILAVRHTARLWPDKL